MPLPVVTAGAYQFGDGIRSSIPPTGWVACNPNSGACTPNSGLAARTATREKAVTRFEAAVKSRAMDSDPFIVLMPLAVMGVVAAAVWAVVKGRRKLAVALLVTIVVAVAIGAAWTASPK